MKRVLLCLLIAMTLVLLIPVTTAYRNEKQDTRDSTDIGWTYLRGIITKPHLTNGGNVVTFRAIFVHYRTHGFGLNQQGLLFGLQLISLPNDFIGVLNNHYVFATFDGALKH